MRGIKPLIFFSFLLFSLWLAPQALAVVSNNYYLNGNLGVGPGAANPQNGIAVGSNMELRTIDNANGSYYGTLKWFGLQLGNNGINKIIAGRTTPGGSLGFFVNNSTSVTNHDQAMDGTLALYIGNNGNVGIGPGTPATNPPYTLNVAGSMNVATLLNTDILALRGKQFVQADNDSILRINYANHYSTLLINSGLLIANGGISTSQLAASGGIATTEIIADSFKTSTGSFTISGSNSYGINVNTSMNLQAQLLINGTASLTKDALLLNTRYALKDDNDGWLRLNGSANYSGVLVPYGVTRLAGPLQLGNGLTTLDISQSPFGSLTVRGDKTSGGTTWGGINFRYSNNDDMGTLMIHPNVQGFMKNDNSGLLWGFSNGTLIAGSVPTSRLSGAIDIASQTQGNLPLSRTSGTIDIVSQTSGDLPASRLFGTLISNDYFYLKNSGNLASNYQAMQYGGNYLSLNGNGDFPAGVVIGYFGGANSNLSVRGNVFANMYFDDDYANYYMDFNGSSKIKNLVVAGTLTSTDYIYLQGSGQNQPGRESLTYGSSYLALNAKGQFTSGVYVGYPGQAVSDLTVSGKTTSNGGFSGNCYKASSVIGQVSGNFVTTVGTNPSACNMDIAEIYSSAEDVASGDILVINSSSDEVKKAKSGYDRKLFGIVTTTPAIIMGYPDQDGNPSVFMGGEANTYQQKPEAKRKPAVALAGKVPAKVNLEGGAIKKGDYLTSSSTPGVAMKANKPGQVIAQAMEDYYTDSDSGGAGGNKKIMVVIHNSYADPNGDLDKLQDKVKSLEERLSKLEKN
jgi:hypothetical protein